MQTVKIIDVVKLFKRISTTLPKVSVRIIMKIHKQTEVDYKANIIGLSDNAKYMYLFDNA